MTFRPYIVYIDKHRPDPHTYEPPNIYVIDSRLKELVDAPLKFTFGEINFSDVQVRLEAYQLLAEYMNRAYIAGHDEARLVMTERLISVMLSDGPEEKPTYVGTEFSNYYIDACEGYGFNTD